MQPQKQYDFWEEGGHLFAKPSTELPVTPGRHRMPLADFSQQEDQQRIVGQLYNQPKRKLSGFGPIDCRKSLSRKTRDKIEAALLNESNDLCVITLLTGDGYSALISNFRFGKKELYWIRQPVESLSERIAFEVRCDFLGKGRENFPIRCHELMAKVYQREDARNQAALEALSKKMNAIRPLSGLPIDIFYTGDYPSLEKDFAPEKPFNISKTQKQTFEQMICSVEAFLGQYVSDCFFSPPRFRYFTRAELGLALEDTQQNCPKDIISNSPSLYLKQRMTWALHKAREREASLPEEPSIFETLHTIAREWLPGFAFSASALNKLSDKKEQPSTSAKLKPR